MKTNVRRERGGEDQHASSDPRRSAPGARAIGLPAVGTRPAVQASAAIIAAPNDPAERQADAVADAVMNSLRGPSPGRPGGPFREPPVRPGAPLSPKGEGAIVGPAPTGFVAALQRARGGGEPIAGGFRRAVEGAMDADFSAVKIHTGGAAEALSGAIQAHAFTSGADIFFDRGQYAPETAAGQRLLTHELAHVVQQQAHAPIVQRYVKRTPGVSIDDIGVTIGADSTFERQEKGEHDSLANNNSPEVANVVTRKGTEDGFMLRISEGGSLAIEDLAKASGNEAKSYYATQDKVDESNRALKGVNSVYRMIPVVGQEITVDVEDVSKTLTKVTPRNLFTVARGNGAPRTATATDLSVTEGLGMLGVQQCIQIATALSGGQQANSLSPVYGTPHLDGRQAKLAAQIGGKLKGVLANAKGFKGSLDNFDADLAALPRSEAIKTLAGLAAELQTCLFEGETPSDELRQLCEDLLVGDPPLVTEELLATQSDSVAKNMRASLDTFKAAARQYAAYLALKDEDDDSEAATQALGLNDLAAPEIGQAFKTTNLELSDDADAAHEWNFHFAGVVARDGADRITLENYTRDLHASSLRDARWYFQMYGPGEQSFHRAWHTEKLSITGVSAKTSSPAPEDQRTLAERLTQARAAFVRESLSRSRNASYVLIVSKLDEAIVLAQNQPLSANHAEIAALVQAAINAIPGAASSKKSKKVARGAALGALRVKLLDIADLLLLGG